MRTAFIGDKETNRAGTHKERPHTKLKKKNLVSSSDSERSFFPNLGLVSLKKDLVADWSAAGV